MPSHLSPKVAFLAGCAAAVAVRAALPHLIAKKLRADLEALNAGDYQPLLSSFAEDGVLRFHVGEHRWSGDHHGKAQVEQFFRDFTAAGLSGEILELYVSGAPWNMTIIARFDDHARGPDGQRIYDNRVVILARTRWGKIVEQEDFYSDTERITTLEKRLQELDAQPVI